MPYGVGFRGLDASVDPAHQFLPGGGDRIRRAVRAHKERRIVAKPTRRLEKRNVERSRLGIAQAAVAGVGHDADDAHAPLVNQYDWLPGPLTFRVVKQLKFSTVCDSWDNTGIREPPNCSPEPTSGFFLTPMLARIWRRGGDSNARWRFWPPKRFSKPPHSAALPPHRALASIVNHSRLVYRLRSCSTPSPNKSATEN